MKNERKLPEMSRLARLLVLALALASTPAPARANPFRSNASPAFPVTSRITGVNAKASVVGALGNGTLLWEVHGYLEVVGPKSRVPRATVYCRGYSAPTHPALAEFRILVPAPRGDAAFPLEAFPDASTTAVSGRAVPYGPEAAAATPQAPGALMQLYDNVLGMPGLTSP